MTMQRRTLLKAAAVLGTGIAWAHRTVAQEAARPRHRAPPYAADCHIHIYNSRFPVAPNAMLLPPDAHVADYRLVQQRLGTTRVVVVQPSTYGTDNRCMLDALAALGEEARGIAVVNIGVAGDVLKRMDVAGVRGIRFNLVQFGATTLDMIEPLSRRIDDLGWHVELRIKGEQIAAAEDLLLRVPTPIVFDHVALVPPDAGTSHPAYRVVRRLIDRGRAWVKLSGTYQESKLGPPGYGDVGAVAAAFIKAAPERVVWGTGWPHPTARMNRPDEATLLDTLFDWAPNEAALEQIVVTNPEALYGFAKAG
ncbi:MAG TPA: amidohydrolase family protein [Stellaceae bacterium]